MTTVLALMLLSACSKDSKETNGNYSFSCYIQDKLQTGEIIEKPQTVAVMHIWNADGKDLSINNTADALDGFAYDNLAKKSVKAVYSELDVTSTSGTLPEGKYLIFVITGSGGYPQWAYSYKTFSITGGNNTELVKVFSLNALSISYDPW